MHPKLINKEKKLSLACIGVGWIGRNRMKAIIDSGYADIAAIVEPNEQNAQEALKLVSSAKICIDSSEIYNIDIDGVVIASPSALHAQQALDALRAGKSVFCQKPLGRTAQEVREIVKASELADRLLSVDLSYRYIKAFQEVLKVVQSDELGKIIGVDLVFHNAYGPEKPWFYNYNLSGGGCVIDLGVHLIDMAMLCLNFPEVRYLSSALYNRGRKLQSNDKEVEDFAKVFIITKDNITISLDCSWHLSAGKDAIIEMTLYGTNGGVSFRNINGSFYDFKAERYRGTSTEILIEGEDNWGGRAGVIWASDVANGKRYDKESAEQFIKTAEIIDSIYGGRKFK